MKTKFFIVLTILLASLSAHAYDESLTKLVAGKTYANKADSLETVLIDNFINKSKGIFWSTPQDVEHGTDFIYWQQAHAIDVIAYAYNRINGVSTTKAYNYKNYMARWVTNHGNNYHRDSSDKTGFLNPYTDDMAWICLALLHIGEEMGNDNYCKTAKDVYDKYIITRATRETGTDGKEYIRLPWNWDKNADGTYKNDGGACTDGSSCLVAVKLYLRYQTDNYLADAIGLYNHMVKNVCKSDGRCEEPPLTYTQGAFGEACRLLYHATGSILYRIKANSYLQYAISSSSRCVYNGLLRNEGTSMDQSLFKAVLIPYLANYILDEQIELNKRIDALKFLVKNADTLWRNLDKDAYPKMYCPYYWGDKFDASQNASMGAMVSGASLMESMARLQKAFAEEEDEETGITDFAATAPRQSSTDIYDMSGRKVSNHVTPAIPLRKGLYIVGSRKIRL